MADLSASLYAMLLLQVCLLHRGSGKRGESDSKSGAAGAAASDLDLDILCGTG